MRVNVTQRDIDNGIRKDATSCPIARSIQRHKDVQEAAVDHTFVTLLTDIFVAESPLPHTAILFVRRFDRGLPVTPFTFNLPEVPRA